MLDPSVLLLADKSGDFGHLRELVDGLHWDPEALADLVLGAFVVLLRSLPGFVDV